MRHALRAVTLMFAMVSACALAAESLPTVWLFHDEWPPEPAQPEIPWKSTGVIVTFCPGGELRVLTGTLYRAKNEVTIAREGLVVLPGTWSGTTDNLEARYVLALGESQSAGPSIRAVHKKTTRPRIVDGGNRMLFEYQAMPRESAREVVLRPEWDLPFRIRDNLVRCD
ncbi:hypothetical protein HNQ60_005161 [Povalibacter uvarum]|uniref:Uncharacterized protein n=1 Tax=Povalibacter uvarum TaxID=732238 RepID=A0A841HVF3_9GAMM|nr:hypothetical protein [Povalibacter uvarum]MBB6096239.1 hypothetical protein [Povalibacter uvarum]